MRVDVQSKLLLLLKALIIIKSFLTKLCIMSVNIFDNFFNAFLLLTFSIVIVFFYYLFHLQIPGHLYKYCGRQLPPIYYSHTSSVEINFITPALGESTKFSLQYKLAGEFQLSVLLSCSNYFWLIIYLLWNNPSDSCE